MTPDKALHWRDLPAPVLSLLRQGSVITPIRWRSVDRQFDKPSQRAISRYYVDAGSSGLAVGVHSTFAIRESGSIVRYWARHRDSARMDRSALVMITGAVR
jgi:hypothetical protein